VRTFVLVDYAWLQYRSFFAFKNLCYKGTPTGAMYGALDFLTRVAIIPDVRVILCMDSRKLWRKSFYSLYKANRTGSNEGGVHPRDLEEKILQAASLLDYVQAVEWDLNEADDIMARLFFMLRGKGDVVIYSGDSDILQLCQFGAKVANQFSQQGGFTYWGNEYLNEKFGINSELLPYWKALKGDRSDNVPNVTSMVPKTVVKRFALKWRELNSYNQALQYVNHSSLKKFVLGEKQALINYKIVDLTFHQFDNNKGSKPKKKQLFPSVGVAKEYGMVQFLKDQNEINRR